MHFEELPGEEQLKDERRHVLADNLRIKTIFKQEQFVLLQASIPAVMLLLHMWSTQLIQTHAHTSNRHHPVKSDTVIHWRLGKLRLASHILESLKRHSEKREPEHFTNICTPVYLFDVYSLKDGNCGVKIHMKD